MAIKCSTLASNPFRLYEIVRMSCEELIMPMKKLGLAIATYNRKDSLLRRLGEAEKFGDVFHDVTICDNSAVVDPDVVVKISGLNNVRYVKNVANIGGGANFIRAIENSSADFIWLRGDDDPIIESAVNAVKRFVSDVPRLIILNHHINSPVEGKGLKDFIEFFPVTQVVGWLSTVVFPSVQAKSSLRWGYSGIHSSFAHVSLILGMFNEFPELAFVIVPVELKEGFRDAGKEGGIRWGEFSTLIEGFPRTSETIQCKRLRKDYLNKWRQSLRWMALIRLMVKQKVGISPREEISWKTFAALRSVSSSSSTAMGVMLWIMSKLPVALYVRAFGLYFCRLSDHERNKLNLEQLDGAFTYAEVCRRLSRENTRQKVQSATGAFL